MKWLLDTNVLSEPRRKNPSPEVANWIRRLPIDAIFSSTINIAELRYGALIAPDHRRRLDITLWIDTRVRPMLGERLLGVDEEVLVRWRALARDLDVARKPAPPVDLLVAAVAMVNGLGVATRDVAPFIACGLPVLNPWTGERFNGA
jgi:hypothetical protein